MFRICLRYGGSVKRNNCCCICNFGLLFDLDNPLVECVDAAITALTDSGELAAIEEQWLSTDAGIPVIAVE